MDNSTDAPDGTPMQHRWLLPTYLVVGIAGLLGNILVIIIISSVRKMQTVTNFFILHQSAIDMTSAVFLLTILLSETALPGDYIMPSAACKLWFNKYPVWACYMASTINLVGLTLERYHAILRPLHHGTVFCQSRVLRFFPLCWLCGFFLISYLIFIFDVTEGSICQISRIAIGLQASLGISTVIFYYFVPLCVMIFAYCSMLWEVRRQWKTTTGEHNHADVASRDQRMRLRVEKNVLKVLALVVAVYAVCWSPNQLAYLNYNFGGSLDFNGWFYHLSVVLITCNMCINPFVYALKYQQFREGMMLVFCRHRNAMVHAREDSTRESGVRNITGTMAVQMENGFSS
ncbi:adenosine receptor A3-like [Asterias amurensis]|uniref:adenosine receptor A3-like n=1 Tax=Asterias amurensis TaxID=7602 RepID=UPI003AB16981